MPLAYLSPALQFPFKAVESLSATEKENFEHRLREVENALLCQAFSGQVPQPSCWEQLQGYINGDVSREEGFRQLYQLP
jgi:hypothetical protein